MQMRTIAGEFAMRDAPHGASFSGLLRIAIARVAILSRTFLSRARSRQKQLAVVESVALGDRRFVSVIQFEGQRFLVGSAPSTVTLLAQLPQAETTPARETAAACEGESR